jgi:hypothetical protein
MRSSRQNKKEESKVKALVQEESSSHAKNKVTPKKAAKVAEEVKEEEEDNRRDETEEIISSPIASPKGSKSRKSVPKVTPQKGDGDSSSSGKSPKNAFGRKTITNEIEGETPVKKAPVDVSPLVELVYRCK